MPYDTIERSNYGSQPLHLYEFVVGGRAWRYVSDEADVVAVGHVFRGVPINDEGIRQSGEAQEDEIKILMPSGEEFAQLFTGTPPSEEIWVTIRRMQRGDVDAPVIWVGTLTSASQRGSVRTELRCHMLTASFNRNGLRLSWGRNCPHALYDMNCRANKAAYALSVQIDSMTGNAIGIPVLAGFPPGYFANGFFECSVIPGVIDRRAIEIHSGPAFSVLGTTDGLKIGDWITLYPGCSRTTVDCSDKFNNLSNYGGIPHLPGKSPFDGTPVF